MSKPLYFLPDELQKTSGYEAFQEVRVHFFFSGRFISEAKATRKNEGKVRESDCFVHAAKEGCSYSKQHLQINFPLHSKHTPAPLSRLNGWTV